MADIVNSLFGIDPAQYQQEQQMAQANANMKLAQMDPLQARRYSLMQAGTDIGNAGMGLLGIQDPQLQQATELKQIASQFNTTTPDGLIKLAQAVAPKYPQQAQQAMAAAQKMQAGNLANKQTELSINKAEMSAAQEEKLRTELASLGPNATDQAVIAVVSKYGSPDKILQVLTASADRKAKLAAASAAGGGENVGQAGPVGKAGAYRDINGMVHGAGEMKVVNQEFAGNQKLLDVLNGIEQKDLKNAESIIDWTTKEGMTKAAGAKFSPETVNAQSKIALGQLKKQIESLPPGSASNADMVAAMKDFPGYGNAENLRLWLNRTKAMVQKNITMSEDQYGLRSRVSSSGDVGATATTSTGKVKQYNPATGKIE